MKTHTVRFTHKWFPNQFFTDCGRLLRNLGDGDPCQSCREARIADKRRAIEAGVWP